MTTIPADRRYFSPSEVAELLEEPVRNIYRWIAQKRIATVRPHRKLKIARDEVERLAGQKFTPENGTH